jgi:predicted nucleic acid-binding protein
MTVNYTVQAEVVDIRSDSPNNDDIFLVDTNVWYWYTYTNASISSRSYQITEYPSYVAKAISVDSLLLYCGLSLAELAHNIEQTERQIFSSTIKPKEYRHNYPVERAKVVAEVETAWRQVISIAACTEILINEAKTNVALTRFQTQLLDGYDLLILEAMDKASVKQIITDDGDYVTVPGIRVFTANVGAISAARSQGKLLVR